MTTVTISLPETLKTCIDEQLATKGYGNVSEYFRSLLRDAQEREEEARIGGKDIPLTRAFWKDLNRRRFRAANVVMKRPAARSPALAGSGTSGSEKNLAVNPLV